MGLLNSVDQQGLNMIARMAHGSGRSEGVNGGRGNMGVVEWDNGHVRVIKYDTHLFGKKTGTDVEKMKAADALRRQLLQFATNANLEDGEMKEIRHLLGLSRDGEGWKAKSLLERKTVAKVLVKIDKDIWTHALEGADFEEYGTGDLKTDFDSVKDKGSFANRLLRRETLPQGPSLSKDVQYLPKTPIERAKPEWRPAIMVLSKMTEDMLSLYAGQISDEQAKLFRAGVERYVDEIEDRLDESLCGELNEEKLNRLQETFRPLINDLALSLKPHMRKLALLTRLGQEAKADRMQPDVEDVFDRKVRQYRLQIGFLPSDQVTEEVVRAKVDEFVQEAEAEARESRIKTIRSMIDPRIEKIVDQVGMTFVQLDMKYPEDKIANFNRTVEVTVQKLAANVVTDDEATRKELLGTIEKRARELFPNVHLN